MDQYNVRRIGDVTIQRLTPMQDDSDEVNNHTLPQNQSNLESSQSSVPQLSGVLTGTNNITVEQPKNSADSKPESQDDDSEDEYSDSDDDYNGDDDDDDELGFDNEIFPRNKEQQRVTYNMQKTDEDETTSEVQNMCDENMEMSTSSFLTPRVGQHEINNEKRDTVELTDSCIVTSANERNKINPAMLLDRRKFSDFDCDDGGIKFADQENDSSSKNYSNEVNADSFDHYKSSVMDPGTDINVHNEAIDNVKCPDLSITQQYDAIPKTDDYPPDVKDDFYQCADHSHDFNSEKPASSEGTIESKDEFNDNYMEQDTDYEKEIENETVDMDAGDYKDNLVDIDGYPTEIPDENLPQELNNEQELYNKDVDDQGDEIAIKEELMDDFADNDDTNEIEKEGDELEHSSRRIKKKRKIDDEGGSEDQKNNDEGEDEEDEGVIENKKCKTGKCSNYLAILYTIYWLTFMN